MPVHISELPLLVNQCRPIEPVVLASFGSEKGDASIIWGFELQFQAYAGRSLFKPVWDHNPYVEVLSAGELGKLCVEQLKHLSE